MATKRKKVFWICAISIGILVLLFNGYYLTYSYLCLQGYRTTKPKDKISYYSKAILLWPFDPALINCRGTAYTRSKQYQKAIEDYTKCLEINPKFYQVYYNRGVAYHRLRQYDKAISDFEKLLEFVPKHPDSLNNLANIYVSKGQDCKAIEAYSLIIESDPDYYQAYFNRALSYYRLDNPKKAIEDFNKVLKMTSTNKILYYKVLIWRAKSLKKDKQYKAALNDCATLIKLRPLPNFYLFRGNIYFEMGKLDEADNDFSKGLELDPNAKHTASLYFAKSKVSLLKNNPEEALEFIKDSLFLNNKDMDANIIALLAAGEISPSAFNDQKQKFAQIEYKSKWFQKLQKVFTESFKLEKMQTPTEKDEMYKKYEHQIKVIEFFVVGMNYIYQGKTELGKKYFKQSLEFNNEDDFFNKFAKMKLKQLENKEQP